MNTPINGEQLLARLNQELEDGRKDLAETSKEDMNSFAAGYDTGWVDALKRAIAILEGEYE